MFASTQLEQPAQFYVWGAVLGVSILSPAIAYIPKRSRKVAERAARMVPSRIERYGLITIIVLGEVIVSAIRGTAELGTFSLRAGLVLGFGLLVN